MILLWFPSLNASWRGIDLAAWKYDLLSIAQDQDQESAHGCRASGELLTMKRILLTLTALAAAFFPAQAAEPQVKAPAAQSQSPARTKPMKNIGVAEFEKLRSEKTNVVLDVRTPTEYAAGHIPGAVNIDFNAPDFDKKIGTLDTNKTYLVHCAAGGRSAKACVKLGQLKFNHLYNLEGGMRAWEKQGNKPEKLDDKLTR
jgi:phage shock protein E